MARYAVSRPTLRTAIRQLEAANRVVTRSGVHGGLYVKDVSATAVMALAWHLVTLRQPFRTFFALHMPFFGHAAMLAAQRAPAIARDRIAELRDEMLTTPPRVACFREARLQLRSAIFAATGNPALEIVGAALNQAYAKILRGELHLGDTEEEKTSRVQAAEGLIVSAILSGDVDATARACRRGAEIEIEITEETVRAGMISARAVPRTLFALVRDGKRPDKLAEHMARALLRELDVRQAPPGAPIGSIPALATRFGVSYDICREAMGLLASHGVVTVRRGRGGGVHAGRPTIAGFAHVVRRDLVAKAGIEQLSEVHTLLMRIRDDLTVSAAPPDESASTVAFFDEMLALLADCTSSAAVGG
ncbi:MAG: GntR family transcriptional regulator [Sphingomonadaceae bacterium]|nr:GntR family transcriptional regulator [Sphingomonadaceae bacterium]